LGLHLTSHVQRFGGRQDKQPRICVWSWDEVIPLEEATRKLPCNRPTDMRVRARPTDMNSAPLSLSATTVSWATTVADRFWAGSMADISPTCCPALRVAI
jgi:hypothetical protein